LWKNGINTKGNAHVNPFINLITKGQEILVETRCRNTLRIFSKGFIKMDSEITKQPTQIT